MISVSYQNLGLGRITHYSSAFVAKNNRECPLSIDSKPLWRRDSESARAHTSGSAPLRVYSSVWQIPFRIKHHSITKSSGMESNLPVYRILILTSCARGGSTSISSSLSGSRAPQHTAALHLMTFPAVSDMTRAT